MLNNQPGLNELIKYLELYSNKRNLVVGLKHTTPERHLLLHIIYSAYLEKDDEYFKGDTFKYHASLLGFDVDNTEELCLR